MHQTNKIINIQFLRAFASLLVLFYHTSAHFFAAGGDMHGNIFSYMSQIGYVGVDIFFVISGYIMWTSTQHILHGHTSSALKFIFKRFTRIYPIYWSFLLLLLLIHAFKGGFNGIDIFSSIFLTFSSSSTLLLQVAWTLQYELYFYLIFSLLLLFSKRYRIYLLTILFITIIFIQFYAIVFLDIYTVKNFNTTSTFYTFWFSPFFIEFLLGVFLAFYVEKRRIKRVFPLFLVATGLVVLALLYQHTAIHATLADGYYMPQRVLLLGTASTLLLALLVELNRREVIIFPNFSLLLGNASYSLYLSHTILLLIIYSLGIRTAIKDFGAYQGIFMSLIMLFIIIFSIFYYKWVELPLMKFFKHKI